MKQTIGSIAAGLAGANMVYESSVMMASLLGASFEAFILDDEMLGAVHRTIRGIEVNEATLGFDAIKDVVLSPEGNDVTEKFIRYVKPLAGDLLPGYMRFEKDPVGKLLENYQR